MKEEKITITIDDGEYKNTITVHHTLDETYFESRFDPPLPKETEGDKPIKCVALTALFLEFLSKK